MQNHPLARIAAVAFSVPKAPSDLTWEEAKVQYQETIAQRPKIVESLLRVAKEDGVLLTGDIAEDCGALGQWLLERAVTKKVPNPLPEDWRTEEDPEFVDEVDAITYNACMVLGLYISVRIEELTGGEFSLKLHKLGANDVDKHLPIIVIKKNRDHLEPTTIVYVTVKRALDEGGRCKLKEAVQRNLDAIAEAKQPL